jgi:hypothetical protein
MEENSSLAERCAVQTGKVTKFPCNFLPPSSGFSRLTCDDQCVDSLTQPEAARPPVSRTQHLHKQPYKKPTLHALVVKWSSTQSAIWQYGCQCGSDFHTSSAVSPVRIGQIAGTAPDPISFGGQDNTSYRRSKWLIQPFDPSLRHGNVNDMYLHCSHLLIREVMQTYFPKYLI